MLQVATTLTDAELFDGASFKEQVGMKIGNDV